VASASALRAIRSEFPCAHVSEIAEKIRDFFLLALVPSGGGSVRFIARRKPGVPDLAVTKRSWGWRRPPRSAGDVNNLLERVVDPTELRLPRASWPHFVAIVIEFFFDARRRSAGGAIATEATYSLTVRRTSRSFSASDFGARALTTLTIFRAIGHFPGTAAGSSSIAEPVPLGQMVATIIDPNKVLDTVKAKLDETKKASNTGSTDSQNK
jgi:hypothetical protein